MDFEFIQTFIKSLETTNIYKFTFVGVKVLAMGLLSIKMLEAFARGSIDGMEIKLGEIYTIAGYGLIIMSSDWIITEIENVFASVNTEMNKTSSDLYSELNGMILESSQNMFANANSVKDKLVVLIENRFVIIGMVFGWIISAVFKIADLSITAGYLIQRVFILQLLKFLFPLTIALSTFSGTQKLFYSWILRYIGVFILGIAYIGIIEGSHLLQTALYSEFKSDRDILNGVEIGGGIIITIIVVFTAKVKAFSTITSYVMGYFQ